MGARAQFTVGQLLSPALHDGAAAIGTLPLLLTTSWVSLMGTPCMRASAAAASEAGTMATSCAVLCHPTDV